MLRPTTPCLAEVTRLKNLVTTYGINFRKYDIFRFYDWALYQIILDFNNPFKNVVGKGENAVKQHFLLFPQRFLPAILAIFTIIFGL